VGKHHVVLDVRHDGVGDDLRNHYHGAKVWLAPVVCEWSHWHGGISNARGQWQDVSPDVSAAHPPPQVAGRFTSEVFVDGLQPGTSYVLRVCTALRGASTLGEPCDVRITTLPADARINEHGNIPEAWRALSLPAGLVEGSSAEASSPSLAVLSRVRASILSVAQNHMGTIVMAFRLACLLTREHADEATSSMRAAERARTSLGKICELSFRRLVIIISPGPNIEAVKALLVAARLHIEQACELVAVVCNGGGTAEVVADRAALARAVLDSQRLYDVPVGMGEPCGQVHKPQPQEYSYPGFSRVDRSCLRDGQELLIDVLEAAAPRSLTFVNTSALSDIARLIRDDELEKKLYGRAALVVIMGGCTLQWDKPKEARNVGLDRPVDAVPDTAANNQIDPESARVVYSWCIKRRIPLRVVGRDATPDVPMRVFKELAEAHPSDPVLRYVRRSQENGLIALWKKVCRGQVPNCDRRWFFTKFCGVSDAEFEKRGFHKLGEDFAIERKLDGTSKPYDAVTLLVAVASEHSPQALLVPFRSSKEAMHVYIFNEARHMAASATVIDVFRQVMHAIRRSLMAGFARFRPRTAESARNALPAGASMHSIALLFRRCGMLQGGVTTAAVEGMFLETAHDRSKGNLSQAAAADAEDEEQAQSGGNSLSLPDFITLLVRFVQAQARASHGSPGDGLQTETRLEKLLVNHLAPKVPLYSKSTDMFLQSILTSDVRAVLAKWTQELQGVFRMYSALEESHSTTQAHNQPTLRLADVLTVVADAELTDPRRGGLNRARLLSLYAQVRGDQEPIDEPGEHSSFRFSFNAFAEFVCRLFHACALASASAPKPAASGESSGASVIKHQVFEPISTEPVAGSQDGEHVPSGTQSSFVAPVVSTGALDFLDSILADVRARAARDVQPGLVDLSRALDVWMDEVFLAALRPKMKARLVGVLVRSAARPV